MRRAGAGSAWPILRARRSTERQRIWSSATERGLSRTDTRQRVGQSRLVELMEVPPDYVKFDMALIRDIHKASPHKQKTLETLVKMVRNLGVAPLAEGIESHDESAVCTDMGFLFAQGFLFGKPTLATCLVAEHVEERFGSPAHTLPHAAASESAWFEQRFGDSQATPWQVHVG